MPELRFPAGSHIKSPLRITDILPFHRWTALTYHMVNKRKIRVAFSATVLLRSTGICTFRVTAQKTSFELISGSRPKLPRYKMSSNEYRWQEKLFFWRIYARL